MISAHESPLTAMAFDMTGTKLATASNKVCRQSVRVYAHKYMNELFSRER